MSIERETIVTRPVERETIVTSNGSSSGGVIAAIVGAVVLVLIVLWMLNGGLNFGRSGSASTVDVNLPKVTVNTPTQ